MRWAFAVRVRDAATKQRRLNVFTLTVAQLDSYGGRSRSSANWGVRASDEQSDPDS